MPLLSGIKASYLGMDEFQGSLSQCAPTHPATYSASKGYEVNDLFSVGNAIDLRFWSSLSLTTRPPPESFPALLKMRHRDEH